MKFLILLSAIVAINGRHVDRNFDSGILNKCVDGLQEFTDCVKYKAIKLLDRVIVNRDPIPLADFLYLTHEEATKNLTESNLFEDEESLVNNVDDNRLTDVLMKRVNQLTATKNLQIKLDADAEQFEGKVFAAI